MTSQNVTLGGLGGVHWLVFNDLMFVDYWFLAYDFVDHWLFCRKRSTDQLITDFEARILILNTDFWPNILLTTDFWGPPLRSSIKGLNQGRLLLVEKWLCIYQ